MRKIIYGSALVSLISIGITACKKQDFKIKHTAPVSNVQTDSPTILGEKKANPFTIKNMRNAYDKLSKSKSNGNNLSPNKLYVRFLPQKRG